MSINFKKKAETDRLKTRSYYVQRCLGYFLTYKWRLLISIISMILVAGSSGFMALLVKPILDDIFINKDLQALTLIPLLIIVLFAIRGVFLFLQLYQMQYCALRVLEQLRNELYSKIICYPLNYFEGNYVGMLMSRIINDVEEIRRSIPQIIMLGRHTLTMVVLFGVAFYRDLFLATWALVILPLVIFPLFYLGKKLRKFGRKRQEHISGISSLLQEVFNSVQLVKASVTESDEIHRFHRQNSKLFKVNLKRELYNSLSTPSMELAVGLGIAVIIWYGGSQVIGGHSTPGTFFSFLTAMTMLFTPFRKLSRSNLVIQQALVGAERVFGILDSRETDEESGGTVPFTSAFKGLSFQKVCFRYHSAGEPALKDINLEVQPGEKLAIVGPSGSGKSTLVNLIPRFYTPQQGKIVLNNKDMSEYTLHSLRTRFGFISHQAILFNASIRDNVVYGAAWETDHKALEEACKKAYAHEFITQLPNGYDTVVGEQGKTLSGGQKQRLAIARVILKSPDLLILDEATSSLDTFSESHIQEALTNLMRGKTCIIIAHRLSTILSADRIVVMDKGRIVDIGSHSWLLKSCELYKMLYEKEFQMPSPTESINKDLFLE